MNNPLPGNHPDPPTSTQPISPPLASQPPVIEPLAPTISQPVVGRRDPILFDGQDGGHTTRKSESFLPGIAVATEMFLPVVILMVVAIVAIIWFLI